MYYFVIIVVTEERKYLLVYEVVPEDTQMKTSYARNSKLFEDIFDTSFKIRIRNTIASILRENLLLYLSLDIHDLSGAHHLICSLKHTFFLIISSFVP